MENSHMQQWRDLKFGMFIHWGLYAILGKGEWAMFYDAIDKDEYAKLAEQFTAERFDAAHWAGLAKAAGMKYMVLTTRHHDGFSLWDSAASVGNFTSVHSAMRRDVVAEYTAACREAGLKVGYYYSPMDWRFEGYFLPRMYHRSALRMKKQCHEQVKELLTQYGKVDILWYDGGEDYWLAHGIDLHRVRDKARPDNWEKNPQIANFWEADKLDKMVRELQPGIVINNRSGSRQYGDFETPECRIGAFNTATPWETCEIISEGSWGWMPGRKVKSLRKIIHLLVQTVTGDGNFLLNVGPRPDGSIAEEQAERLKQIGRWMDLYGESIYGTRGGPFVNDLCAGATWKGNTMYLHVLDWQQDDIRIPATPAMVQISSLTAAKMEWKREGDMIVIAVSDDDKTAIDTIIKVEFDRNVDAVYPIGFAPLSKTGDEIRGAFIVEQL